MIGLSALSAYKNAAIGIVLLVLVGAVGVQTVRLSREETKLANLEAVQAKAHSQQLADLADATNLARRREAELVADAARLQEQKNEAVHVLSVRLAAALGELRNRPERPAEIADAAPAAGSPGAAGTGAGLYREDGEFLAGEAAAAARIAAERDQCIAQYEGARQKMIDWAKASGTADVLDKVQMHRQATGVER